MKILHGFIFALLASSTILSQTIETSNLGLCADNIRKSINSIKIIRTELFSFGKYRELISELISLRSYVVEGVKSCSQITEQDLMPYLIRITESKPAKCIMKAWQLLQDSNTIRLCLSNREFREAYESLPSIVVRVNEAQAECAGVAFPNRTNNEKMIEIQ